MSVCAALVAAVVQPGKALRHRRSRHVQRSLDGARRAVLDPECCVFRIHAHVEVPVQAQARRQQAGLATRAELVQVGNASPVFVGSDVQVLDGLEQVGQDAVEDHLGAGVAALLVLPGGQTQEVLDFVGVENLNAHGVSPFRGVVGNGSCRMRFGRRCPIRSGMSRPDRPSCACGRGGSAEHGLRPVRCPGLAAWAR